MHCKFNSTSANRIDELIESRAGAVEANYNVESDFERMRVSGYWRITNVNRKYQVLEFFLNSL